MINKQSDHKMSTLTFPYEQGKATIYIIYIKKNLNYWTVSYTDSTCNLSYIPLRP